MEDNASGGLFLLGDQKLLLKVVRELKMDGLLGEVHAQLLSGAIIRVKKRSDNLLSTINDFLEVSTMVREGCVSREQLATIVEQNRASWESDVSNTAE